MIDLGILEKGTFVQQMLYLDELENKGDPGAVDALAALLDRDSLDESLRQVVGDTLRSLLVKNPSKILEGLESSSIPLKIAAIQLAGQLGLKEAGARLSGLARNSKDTQELISVLSSLGKVADISHAEIFREKARHDDPLVASVCVQQLGALGDVESVCFFDSLLVDAGSEENYEYCSMVTDSAIGALACLGTEEAANVLIGKIHHKSPTVRRLIHGVLVGRGQDVVDRLGRFFDTGTVDEKIMAASLLGQIRSPRGADIMLSALDSGKADDANVRFAIFDAFGQIPSLKTLVSLIDALGETDEMTLIAVVTSLNRFANQVVAEKVRAAMAADSAQAGRVARATLAAKAVDLFKALYQLPGSGEVVMEELKEAKDPDIIEVFVEALNSLGTPSALEDAKAVSGTGESTRQKRVLTVDDSRSILLFYKAVLSGMGFEVVTAEHGKAALDVLAFDNGFDLIITDMNMPEMNGIELSRKVRERDETRHIPIVMATTESDQSQIAMADRAGVNGYLVKPIKPDALSGILEKTLK